MEMLLLGILWAFIGLAAVMLLASAYLDYREE